MLQNGMLQGIFFQVSDVVHVPLVFKKIVVENDGNMHICSIVLLRTLMLTLQKELTIQLTCFLHI